MTIDRLPYPASAINLSQAEELLWFCHLIDGLEYGRAVEQDAETGRPWFESAGSGVTNLMFRRIAEQRYTQASPTVLAVLRLLAVKRGLRYSTSGFRALRDAQQCSDFAQSGLRHMLAIARDVERQLAGLLRDCPQREKVMEAFNWCTGASNA